MKKTLLILQLLLFALTLQAQDIILDPIEQDPKLPTARSLASGNWGYYRMGIDEAYKQIHDRAQRPVAVFVFDTGGRLTHTGLQQAAWNEMGAVYTGEDDPEDGNGHSTHVSSSYAGIGAAGEAVGICTPLLDKGLIRIIPIKVLTNLGTGSFARIIQGVKEQNEVAGQLIEDGYFVVYNFSLGGGAAVIDAMETELQSAKDLGVFIAAASGNDGREGVIYPAAGPASHAVGAVNRSDTRAYFSNYGEQLEFALPGQGIYGCWKGDTYAELSGTSMATPHAGAAAAILGSIYKTASAEQISNHLKKHSFDLGDPGWDRHFGYGLPDLESALAAPIGDEPPPPPPDDPGDPGRGGGLPWWAWALIGVTVVGVVLYFAVFRKKSKQFSNAINTRTMKAQNQFGYDEIVDTFSKLINAIIGFLATVEGGFNLIKFLNYALKTYPDLENVYDDFGTFTAQLLDLTPQEALNAVGEIDASTPDHPVSNKIVGFLKISAVSYDFVSKTIGGAKAIGGMVRDFFAPKAA